MFAARALSRSVAPAVKRSFHASSRAMAEAEAAQGLKLNFATPNAPLFVNSTVDMVVIPGIVGEYGMTAGHTPVIAELKPGVVQVYLKAGDTDPEKYFISGGFAISDANSVTNISAPEAVKLDDLDVEAAKKGMAEFRSKMDAAPADSVERAEAQISFEVYEAMCLALGTGA